MLPSGAGYCSTEQQYSGGGVVTLQCMIAAERLLAATLVYMMLILAGDIETNPGPTLCELSSVNFTCTFLHKFQAHAFCTADTTSPIITLYMPNNLIVYVMHQCQYYICDGV